jgi:hypothetical protein
MKAEHVCERYILAHCLDCDPCERFVAALEAELKRTEAMSYCKRARAIGRAMGMGATSVTRYIRAWRATGGLGIVPPSERRSPARNRSPSGPGRFAASARLASIGNEPACLRCGLRGEHECIPESAAAFAAMRRDESGCVAALPRRTA